MGVDSSLEMLVKHRRLQTDDAGFVADRRSQTVFDGGLEKITIQIIDPGQ